VGSLSACYFAKRGHEVHLYEYREDIRKSEHVRGRSINLAMSARGIEALKEVGLADQLINRHGIPMKGRMIHNLDGSQHPILYDPRNKQCIYSVSRRYLNEVLLSATETRKHGFMTFQMTNTNETLLQKADLIVGADGAFSAVRRHFMKQSIFDYSQTYIEHGYLELCMPPGEDGEFVMQPNYLHIWPRGTFMMIALPNQDRSWTVTLFMPFVEFHNLDSPSKLLKFFSKYFPDSITLIGKQRLVKDFFATKSSPLVSIKCRPYHSGNAAIILGDAAHAMVPFYGQGMNAGFEDCRLLDKLMVQYDFNLPTVLQEFSSMRNEDAEAICDLAMYNYLEMRDLVNRRSFLVRKKIDNMLFWLFPNVWVPLYQSVTFTHTGYKNCLDNKRWQDGVIRRMVLMFGVVVSLLIAIAVSHFFKIVLKIQHGIFGNIQYYFF
ncbi:hypothetical protein L9F63_012742, partial [Diploptera punctata]